MSKLSWKHVFVVYRIDYKGEWPIRFTVKSIWEERGRADEEVDRLNNLNRDKGCEYEVQCGKQYEQAKETIPALETGASGNGPGSSNPDGSGP